MVVVFGFFDYCFVVWVVVVVELVCIVIFVVGIDDVVVIESEQEGVVIFDVIGVVCVDIGVVVQQFFVLDYVFIFVDWCQCEYVIVMNGGFVCLDFFGYLVGCCDGKG